jgi:hypothetical protein
MNVKEKLVWKGDGSSWFGKNMLGERERLTLGDEDTSSSMLMMASAGGELAGGGGGGE